jgi:hypothetical protein
VEGVANVGVAGECRPDGILANTAAAVCVSSELPVVRPGIVRSLTGGLISIGPITRCMGRRKQGFIHIDTYRYQMI